MILYRAEGRSFVLVVTAAVGATTVGSTASIAAGAAWGSASATGRRGVAVVAASTITARRGWSRLLRGGGAETGAAAGARSAKTVG